MSPACLRGPLLAAAAAVALSACATSPYRRAGNAGEVASALARSQAPASASRSLVFLVLGGAAGPRIAAYDLAASRQLWTQPGEVTTRRGGTQVLWPPSMQSPYWTVKAPLGSRTTLVTAIP